MKMNRSQSHKGIRKWIPFTVQLFHERFFLLVLRSSMLHLFVGIRLDRLINQWTIQLLELTNHPVKQIHPAGQIIIIHRTIIVLYMVNSFIHFTFKYISIYIYNISNPPASEIKLLSCHYWYHRNHHHIDLHTSPLSLLCQCILLRLHFAGAQGRYVTFRPWARGQHRGPAGEHPSVLWVSGHKHQWPGSLAWSKLETKTINNYLIFFVMKHDNNSTMQTAVIGNWVC